MQKIFGTFIFVAFVSFALGGQYCFQKLTDAQNAFNRALGVNYTLNWNNVDSLWNFVQTQYMSDPPHGFRYVCSANKAYKSVLMTNNDYMTCVKTIQLISNDDGTATNVSLGNAMNYMALINSFDFTCGAGFGLFANNAACLSQVFQNSHEALKSCRDNLNYQLLNGSPTMACTYVADSLNCTRTVFKTCGQWGAYFGCEYARTPSISLFPQCSGVKTNCLVTNYL
jgi:hypothetical protein